jgi:hypothetical protein
LSVCVWIVCLFRGTEDQTKVPKENLLQMHFCHFTTMDKEKEKALEKKITIYSLIIFFQLSFKFL